MVQQAYPAFEKVVQEELPLGRFLGVLLLEEPRWHVLLTAPASSQEAIAEGVKAEGLVEEMQCPSGVVLLLSSPPVARNVTLCTVRSATTFRRRPFSVSLNPAHQQRGTAHPEQNKAESCCGKDVALRFSVCSVLLSFLFVFVLTRLKYRTGYPSIKAAHFSWGLWALIQAKHSTIDFDFRRYAAARFSYYFEKKEEYFGMKLP
ncbi:hypothetical protein AOLI_G00055600 [Acnodon oligacanthus]